MGKVSGGIFGRVSGKVGNVVFANTLGGDAVKAYQPNVSNPKTPLQVAQRSRQKGIVRYSQQILTTINVTLKDVAIGMSPYNKFFQLNVARVNPDDSKFITTQIQNIEFSKGKLEQLNNVVIGTGPNASIPLDWDNSGYLPITSPNDQVYYFVLNINKDFIYSGSLGVIRSAGSGSITNVGDAGNGVRVFLCTVNPITAEASNTQYIGSYTLA